MLRHFIEGLVCFVIFSCLAGLLIGAIIERRDKGEE